MFANLVAKPRNKPYTITLATSEINIPLTSKILKK